MGHWADGTRVAIETATKGEGGAREAEGEDPGPEGHVRPFGPPAAQKSVHFRHPSPEPNTDGKRLTCDG